MAYDGRKRYVDAAVALQFLRKFGCQFGMLINGKYRSALRMASSFSLAVKMSLRTGAWLEFGRGS